MVTKFAELPDPWWGRVLQTYLILVGHATRRETTTYPTLAKQLGTERQSINALLRPLSKYCERNHLPRLSVLVVSAINGEPGRDSPGPRESIYTERENVYKYPWLLDVPPTIQQLMELAPNRP